MDISTLTDQELSDLIEAALAEREARGLLQSSDDAAEALAQTVHAARERNLEPGEYLDWFQPIGVGFPVNAKVNHLGKVWRSTTPNNVWEPGVSGWEEFVEDGGIPPWIQPTGAHDAYYIEPTEGQKGPRCTHVGQIWLTLVDANTWEPSESVPTLWKDEGAAEEGTS